MQTTIRVLGMLALAATIFATNLTPDEVKKSCEKKLLAGNGISHGLFRHPMRCDKFLNCAYKPGSTAVRGIEVACPSGHYFSEELNICVDAGSIPCKLDPCLLSSGVVFIPHPVNCNRYFKCTDGVSEDLCCPAGIGWDTEHQRCMKYDCEQSCHEDIRPESHIAVGNVKNSLTNCLKFDFSTAFSAIKNVRVELIGVQRVAGSVVFEAGNFLRLTYYQRMEWNNEFVLTINFKVTRTTAIDAVLISNGDFNNQPTLHVGLHNDDVTATVVTHGLHFRDRKCTLTAKAKHIKNWTRVTVAFAGYRNGKGLTLKVDEKSRQTPCIGDLELALNPFIVGKGMSGYINDLQLCGASPSI